MSGENNGSGRRNGESERVDIVEESEELTIRVNHTGSDTMSLSEFIPFPLLLVLLLINRVGF